MPNRIRGLIDYSKCKPPANVTRPRKHYVRHAKAKADRGKPWTFEEKQRLKKLCETMSLKEATALMDERTYRAVSHMASLLGVRKPCP